MSSSVARKLWAVARHKGGSIMLDDVSESDIAHGRANGWLRSVGIGHFEATDELRKAAAFIIETTDVLPSFASTVPRGTMLF